MDHNKVNLEKALEDFKNKTGVDYMKMLMGDEFEKQKWKDRLAEDKKRIDESEKELDNEYFTTEFKNGVLIEESELSRLIAIEEAVRVVIDGNTFSGSKSRDPRYVAMIPCDKYSDLLDAYNIDGSKEAKRELTIMSDMRQIIQKAKKEKGWTKEDLDQWFQDYKDGKW